MKLAANMLAGAALLAAALAVGAGLTLAGVALRRLV